MVGYIIAVAGDTGVGLPPGAGPAVLVVVVGVVGATVVVAEGGPAGGAGVLVTATAVIHIHFTPVAFEQNVHAAHLVVDARRHTPQACTHAQSAGLIQTMHGWCLHACDASQPQGCNAEDDIL